jgi:hypothetical protein
MHTDDYIGEKTGLLLVRTTTSYLPRASQDSNGAHRSDMIHNPT